METSQHHLPWRSLGWGMIAGLFGGKLNFANAAQAAAGAGPAIATPDGSPVDD